MPSAPPRLLPPLLLCLAALAMVCCGGETPGDRGAGSPGAAPAAAPTDAPPPPPTPSIRPTYTYDQRLRLALVVIDPEGALAAALPETGAADPRSPSDDPSDTPSDAPSDALAAALRQRWGAPLHVTPLRLPIAADTVEAPRPQLPSAAVKALLPYDRALFAVYRNGALLVRELLPLLDAWSAPLDEPIAPHETTRRLIVASELLLSWSGRVVEVAPVDQGGLVRVALRGSGLLLGREAPVREGEQGRFDYHRPGELDRFQAIRGSFGVVTRVEATGGGVALTIQRSGWYKPKVGDRWRRLHLPAGARRLRVVDAGGRPLPGYVVYAADGAFSRAHDRYAGTTGSDGDVVLEAPRAGAVRHVQVVSTVEGVDFIFFQGLIEVGSGLAPWTVRLRTESSLSAQAQQVAARMLSAAQMRKLRQNIQALLDASAMAIRNGAFEESITKLEEALRLLAGVENADATGLRETVARLKARYEQTRKRQQKIDLRTELLRQLARADSAIYSGNFRQGRALLEQAAERWPSKLFPDRAQLIASKLTQARRLLAETDRAIGRARQNLLRTAAQLEDRRLSPLQIEELAPLITIVARDGVPDPEVHYSDAELLSRLKLRLDRVSAGLAADVTRLKLAYDASEDVAERTRIYEESERKHQFRLAIDALLRKLVDEPIVGRAEERGPDHQDPLDEPGSDR